LDALEAVLPDPQPAATALHETRSQFRKLRKQVKQAGRSPGDTTLHDLRKRAKRVRYAAERADAAGEDSVAGLGSRAKALQDVLGIHQDAVVGEATLRELAADPTRPPQTLAIRRPTPPAPGRPATAPAQRPHVEAPA